MTNPTVSHIEILRFSRPINPPVRTAFGNMDARPCILVRLEDDQGVEGWGEIWCNYPPGGAEYRARLASRILGDALIGLPADAPAATSTTVGSRLHKLALQAGEPGPIAQITAGVDIALHDLQARRLGQSLAALLGAPLGDKGATVPCYASGIDNLAGEETVARARDQGYRAFKVKIGYGEGDGLPCLRRVFDGLAAGETLMTDANQAWDLTTALARVAEINDLALDWLEEPIPVDRPDAEWLALQAASRMPLAGGENMRGLPEFQHAIGLGALTTFQPDAAKWGGLSGCLAVARAAMAGGRRYCPHYLGGGVGLVASAHLLAAAGGDGLLEVDFNQNPLRDVLAGGALPIQGGLFHLPDGPGLGYVPDVAGLGDLLAERLEVTVD